MEPYDWNKEALFNGEPPKPEMDETDPVCEADPVEAAEQPAGAELEESRMYAHIGPAAEQQPVGADAHIGPAAEQQPAGADDHIGPAAEQPAQPAYNDFYYASGPVHTARPDQSYRPEQTYRPAYQPQKPKAEKTGSGGFWKKAVALALVCALLGGAAGFGGAYLMNRTQKTGASTSFQMAAPRETKEINVVTVETGKLMNAAQVYEKNVNSTVGITTEITTNWWGYQSTSAAAGSGFILTEDGYILTNEHVIEDANTITVAMYDGTTYPATLVGYDVSNDIAVLKIDAEGLTPVTLGDSDAMKVGDEVVAIGNPLGELTFSLTKGNVSALNRAVTLSSNVTMNLIQTDTAINSGNSGGALFNMYGEVVGITNAKYSSSGYSGQASIDNIGFAIPINSVREIVTSIIEKGYISTPYIGVTVDNVSEESQNYGMPQGAAIRSVEEDSPAQAAGLKANDIVTAVNGETITTYKELAEFITGSEVGDKLELTVYRRGETLTITVTVGERTQSALPNQQSGQQQSGQSGQGQNGQGQFPWGGEGGSGTFPWG